MRNAGLEAMDGLVGQWRTTLSDAWFLEPGVQVSGSTTVEWLGEAFLLMRVVLEGEDHEASEMTLVFGRSDANGAYVALYHDERGTCREFAMTFGGGDWTMSREDPDFHQRFVADVEQDRVLGRWEASDDRGITWRKDFDLTFERA